ncbi:MAG: hypothetical protein IIC90_02625 [Chloroflexi bacterium]|nr:hypothetical protein [Chloroflexota bacterium]
MGRWRSDEDDEPRYASDARDEDEADDDDELEGEWELDPNDPSHPDYDLSVDAGYAGWEATPRPPLIRRGVVLLVTALVIIGLVAPILLRLAY